MTQDNYIVPCTVAKIILNNNLPNWVLQVERGVFYFEVIQHTLVLCEERIHSRSESHHSLVAYKDKRSTCNQHAGDTQNWKIRARILGLAPYSSHSATTIPSTIPNILLSRDLCISLSDTIYHIWSLGLTHHHRWSWPVACQRRWSRRDGLGWQKSWHWDGRAHLHTGREHTVGSETPWTAGGRIPYTEIKGKMLSQKT